MNKHSLGKKLAKKLGIPMSRMEETLDLTFELIREELAKGGAVTLSGFGSFQVSKRKGGLGFNPHTKKEISIPETKTVRFRPGVTLKKRVNGQKI
jgi:DNA-binding protein HU-beta